MAVTNKERVGKGLDLLAAGLQPFVERELKSVHGDNWLEVASGSFRSGRRSEGAFHWDAHGILTIMWDQWNTVFGRTLGHADRSLVSELREARNNWAHQKTFSTNDAHRALDSMSRILSAVSAPEASEVEQMRLKKTSLVPFGGQLHQNGPQTGERLPHWKEQPHAILRAWCRTICGAAFRAMRMYDES